MDTFSLAVFVISEAESVLGLYFFSHFLKCRARLYHYLIYMAVSGVLIALEMHLQFPLTLSLPLEIALLWLIGMAFYKGSFSMSALAAIITFCILVLSNGIMNSVSYFISPVIIRIDSSLILAAVIFLCFLSVLLAWAGYQLILKKFSLPQTLPDRYLIVLFLPILLVLMMERYISERVYGNVVTLTETGVVHPAVDNWQILIVQLFAYFSLFSILYASQKLSEDYSNRTRLALLEQEIHGQKEYLREAEMRNRQTQAFRHDIKSHLLALEGLLKCGETEKARAYLCRLEEISQSLSLLCRTGNTVVDTLLSNKLSAAQQNEIEIECVVKIPSSCAIDNLDLCVIFSNAVDNAVKACEQLENGTRYIRISGKQKGDLFLLEIENSRSVEQSYQKGSGLGLSNIETVAEKYHGAVATETGETWFRLNVLLVIPRHLTDISADTA